MISARLSGARRRHPGSPIVQALLAALIAALIAGCERLQRPTLADACAAPTTARCAIASAQLALDGARDPASAASGAASLALAQDAAGDSTRARELLAFALEQAQAIDDAQARGNAWREIMAALGDLQPQAAATALRDQLLEAAIGDVAAVRAKLQASATAVTARHESAALGLQQALSLAQDSEVAANAKAVALRGIAGELAARGDFAGARQAIDAITMSIRYYQAMARTDVALHAIEAGKIELAEALLDEAGAIGRAQDNGYFAGAVLRDIGFARQQLDEPAVAMLLFEDAVMTARRAPTANERARATSRIASRLADAKLLEETDLLLEFALEDAAGVAAGPMQSYTRFEIAGAAAFSGDFALARNLAATLPDEPFGGSSSVASAAQRDLAWGLARFGRVEEAFQTCSEIGPVRERVQAYSRVARLLINPGAAAHPRYL